jgi:sugar fermentation stimulation protein A
MVQFSNPLVEGKLLKRYKRFFADVELEGEVVTAHVPNTGSMKSCNNPGSLCRLSRSDDPKRALKFTLEAVKANDQWVGVNTGWPNKLAIEVFKQQKLVHWSKYDSFQAEVKINDHSRIDLMLWDSKQTPVKKWKVTDFQSPQPVHFIEIKNVTLKEGVAAQFPDAVTERGQKHLLELCELMDRGYTAEMLFIVQRSDVEHFTPAKSIDSEYARLLKAAVEKGLIVTVLSFSVSERGIDLIRQLPVKL